MKKKKFFLKLWCKITKQRLVKLIDFDGEETLVPAYIDVDGSGLRLAKRFWPDNLYICILLSDGTVKRYIKDPSELGRRNFVEKWEYVRD